MKLLFDFHFTYKHTLRFLLLHKLGYKSNTYSLPVIKKLKFFFSLRRFENLDSPEIYNYLYLFKYFFGRNAFFTKNKSYFVLGKWYNNFNVNMIINNIDDIFPLLFFFFNNIGKNLDISFLKKGFFSKKRNIFYFIIKDMNIFSELKTNSGLFKLNKPLNIHLYFSGLDYFSSNIFLNNIKQIKKNKMI